MRWKRGKKVIVQAGIWTCSFSVSSLVSLLLVSVYIDAWSLWTGQTLVCLMGRLYDSCCTLVWCHLHCWLGFKMGLFVYHPGLQHLFRYRCVRLVWFACSPKLTKHYRCSTHSNQVGAGCQVQWPQWPLQDHGGHRCHWNGAQPVSGTNLKFNSTRVTTERLSLRLLSRHW